MAEVCYCSSNSCNGATGMSQASKIFWMTAVIAYLVCFWHIWLSCCFEYCKSDTVHKYWKMRSFVLNVHNVRCWILNGNHPSFDLDYIQYHIKKMIGMGIGNGLNLDTIALGCGTSVYSGVEWSSLLLFYIKRIIGDVCGKESLQINFIPPFLFYIMWWPLGENS